MARAAHPRQAPPDSGLRAPAGTAARRRWASAVAATVLILDQASKAWVVAQLAPGRSVPLLGSWLSLTLVENTGAAFSVLAHSSALLAAFAAVAAAALWWLSGRLEGRGAPTALGLILGGALGNLVDRLARHAVVDFVNIHVWPAFNVADSAITVGALWLLWTLVRAPAAEGAHDRATPT